MIKSFELRLDTTNIDAAITTYTSSFQVLAVVGLGVGILVYFLSPLLYARMHECSEQHGVSWITRLYDRVRGTGAQRPAEAGEEL